MNTDPIKQRHYSKVPQLIRRDKGDVPPMRIQTLIIAVIIASAASLYPSDLRPRESSRPLSTPAPEELYPPLGRILDPELDNAKALLVEYHPKSAVCLGGGVNATDLTDVKDRPVILASLKRVGWSDNL